MARVCFVIFADRVAIVLARQNLAKILDSPSLVTKEVEAPSRAVLPSGLEDELIRRAVWGLVACLELCPGLVPLTDPAKAK